jgi:hypothetical protein
MKKKKKQQNKSSLMPIFIILTGSILTLAALLWGVFSQNSRQATVIPPTQSIASESPVPRVSVQDAKAAYDQQAAVFVDVRDAQSFAASHIQGAINIPLNDLPARYQELNPEAWIITY